MDVYPDWAATPGSTYTVAAFENNVQIGTPQPITPGKQKRVNLD